MVSPVVGLPHVNPPMPSVNSTTSDSNDFGYIPFWGLWGPETWQCEPLYNLILEITSEFNKAGSNSASTIMALLPSLMAFTPVVTANIGFLCHLSTTQGFIAAAFTIGLPVRQLNTWKQVTIRVSNLLESLQSCHDNFNTVLRPFTEVVDILLAPIKNTALLPSRPIYLRVLILRFVFGSAQGGLIWLLVTLVPFIDTFYLIWLCPNWGGLVFGMWIGATFVFLGWMRARFERDAFGGDEVIYISKISTTLNYRHRLWESHPMIVILRPSEDASEREPCWTNRLHIRYFIGIFQLFWICFLSFLFSSTIGGNLFRTLLMVVTFITIVCISRGFSILACWLAQQYLDLKIIEYDNLQEKKAMQRLLGGLTGVQVDIRWVRYRKDHWQESVKMYQWGHQLSHGNVMEMPDHNEQCTLHTQIQRRDALVGLLGRLVVVALTAWAAVASRYLAGYHFGPEIDPGILRGVRIIIFASTFSCLYLGRTKRLLICNCNRES